MTTICKNAFAKVNTSLVLGKKRHDGYHEIKTVMLQISLHDKIEFRQTEEKSSLEIKGELSGGISVSEDNLILKALNNIKKIAQINDNYKIILTKNIPSQAGLGGGSSDAGAVISFIKKNIIYQLNMHKNLPEKLEVMFLSFYTVEGLYLKVEEKL